MTTLKLLSLIFRSLIILIAFLGLLVITLDFMNLSFTIEGGRRVLVEQIKSYTGREVRIDGEVELTVSLSPQLLVQRIHISNIDGFSDEDFITVSKVRLAASLLPLLTGQFHLSDIVAEQAKIKLIKKQDGSNNWSFDNATQSSKPADTDTRKSGMGRLSIGIFQLTNIAISYKDESRNLVINEHLKRLMINIKDVKKPLAEISGSVQGYPYNITFEADALEISPTGEPWLSHGTGHIAGSQTKIETSLQVEENAINGDVDINVKKVNLGRLLDTLGIISGQDAATDNINIKTKVRGSDLVELYQQAEIELQLGKGYWNLQSRETDQAKELFFTRASAFTSWNKPLELHIDGNIADEAIKLDVKTNRLLEFFDEVKKLDIDLKSSIADTKINLKGTLDLPIKTKQFHLNLSLKGKDLEKLNPILNTEFPPFNNYNLVGNLTANTKGFILKSAKASIGDSQLQASIVIETNLPKPLWTINLSSRQIQLNDFTFDDWNIKQTDTITEKTSKQKNNDEPIRKLLRQLDDRARAQKMHINLNLNVDKVLSGEALLGKAQFQLQQRDNVFNLENADIEFPGGRVTASISLQVENNEASGYIKLDTDKLDYGKTARLFIPDSEVDGVISARVDLQLGGSNFTRLLDKATGQIDVAIWPQNTQQPKVLKMWATNLFFIVLPEINKKQSKVNCIVSLMDVDDGILQEELFGIDSTKLIIDGNIRVDFKQERLELSLFPRSKTARIFALETPMRVAGKFSDIHIAVKPLDMASSYVAFVTSPIFAPMLRIFGDKVPEDGSALCEQLFDRDHVKKLKAEIEKEAQKEIDEMLESD